MKENFGEKQESGIDYYQFKDGRFSFWEAQVGDQILIFRVREDDYPGKRASEKGVPRGEPLHPASQEHIDVWLRGHPDYEIIKEI